jgi:predicted nucleic acid-binding protein
VGRYVLDTNQIVATGSGWLDNGPPDPDPVHERRLLIHVAKNETGLYCSQIAGEYLEKLLDRGSPPERAVRMIQYLIGAFEKVETITEHAHHPPTDADDEIFVICALDGNADLLISEDAAVLELQPHYLPLIISCARDETLRLGI